jgi:linoleoyl-CoA desaturase
MTIVTPSRAARWFAGELNFHTEHHLFPRAPMDRLADIQPVVRDTLRELGLPYNEYPTFRASWRAFHRHLVAMAAPVDGDPQVSTAAR